MAIMDVVSKLPSIAMTLGIIYILCIAAYAAYLFINRKDQTILPPTDAWWWPTTLNQYVHVYHRPYKYMSNVSAPTSYVSNTYSNVTATDCKTKCEEFPDECIGFGSDTTAKTCDTYSSVGYPIEDPNKNLYVVEGNEPEYMYATYTGKAADENTAASSIASINTDDYYICASTCSDNPDCLGFEYNSATKECRQHTNIVSSNLSSNVNFTSYILQDISMSVSPI
jgi:hypothetical protein